MFSLCREFVKERVAISQANMPGDAKYGVGRREEIENL
jgi:hypothetical protein